MADVLAPPPVAPPATPPVAPPPSVAAGLVPPATPPAAPVYALKAPEGSVFKPDAIERTTAFAAKSGLSPELAQAVLDQQHAEVLAHQNTLMAEAEQVRRVDWVNMTKSDPEIGGQHFPATLQAAARARAEFFNPEFNKMLEDTGLGNHPEFVRAWAKVGQRMGQGPLVNPGGGTVPDGRKSNAEVMYGTPTNGSSGS